MNEFHRSSVSFSVVLFLLFIIFSEPLSWPSDGKKTYPAAFLLAKRTDKPGCKPTPTMSKHTWRTWDEGNLYWCFFFFRSCGKNHSFQREVNCNVNWSLACEAGGPVFASFCSWIRRGALNKQIHQLCNIKNSFHSSVLTLMFLKCYRSVLSLNSIHMLLFQRCRHGIDFLAEHYF